MRSIARGFNRFMLRNRSLTVNGRDVRGPPQPPAPDVLVPPRAAWPSALRRPPPASAQTWA